MHILGQHLGEKELHPAVGARGWLLTVWSCRATTKEAGAPSLHDMVFALMGRRELSSAPCRESGVSMRKV